MELYCEKQYETYDDRCYIYYTSQLAWADALQYCVDNDNGNLASAKNETQQEFLSNISSIYTGDYKALGIFNKCYSTTLFLSNYGTKEALPDFEFI